MSTETPLAELPWTEMPGPPGGPVTDISVSSADPSYIYASTITAGAYASFDGGDTWIQGLSGMHHKHRVWASPHDPEVAYTSRRTDDGGRHWYGENRPSQYRYPPPGGEIGDLAWDPFDEETLYAAGGEGFFKSIDGGTNWEHRTVDQDVGEVVFVEPDPTQEGIVYAGIPETGVARSTDRGETWSLVSGSSSVPDQSLRGLALDTASGDMYLAFDVEGVFRLSEGSLQNVTRDFIFPYWTNQLHVSADDNRVFFIATPWDGESGDLENRRLYSLDATSEEVSRVETPEAPTAVLPHPEDSATVYLGGMRWVFESRDEGSSWTALSEGFYDHYLNAVSVNPSNPDTIIPGSACSSGITVSQDGGETFDWKRSGLEPFQEGKFNEHYVRHIDTLDQMAYATTEAGLLISEDNGGSWRLLVNEFSGAGNRPAGGSEPAKVLDGLAIDPQDPEVLYVGTGIVDEEAEPRDAFEGESRIWKSEDGGGSWREITAGYPTDRDTVIDDIVVSTHDTDRVYVGTGTHGLEESTGEGAGVFLSTDGGDQWTRLTTPFSEVRQLTEDPENPDVLYASTPEGVYRTEDSGDSWQHVLEDETFALLADPTRPGVVYAGSMKYDDYWDVLLTRDGGEQWAEGDFTIQVGTEASEREPDAVDIHSDYWNERGQIVSFSFDQTNSLLYSVTRGAGLWRADTSTLEPEADS